jgi:Reverse transcriptase (RNA-dependent DNA polymerase)
LFNLPASTLVLLFCLFEKLTAVASPLATASTTKSYLIKLVSSILSFTDKSINSDHDPEPEAPVAPPIATIIDDTPDSPPDSPHVVDPRPKVIRELRKLTGFFNPDADTLIMRDRATSNDTSTGKNSDKSDTSGVNNDTTSPSSVVVEDNDRNGNDINDGCAYMMIGRLLLNDIALSTGLMEGTNKVSPTSYKDIYDAPINFHEAYFHDDKWQQSQWQVAIKNDLAKMEQYKVWEVVPRTKIPPNRRCVKHKWIFDIKRNGIFRARLVARGCSQVPGLDFTEAYSPVINDDVFRIMIILQMTWKSKSNIIDVETAFLHGDLDKEIFMDYPQGFENKATDCLLLKKSLYGLVKSARQFLRNLLRC